MRGEAANRLLYFETAGLAQIAVAAVQVAIEERLAAPEDIGIAGTDGCANRPWQENSPSSSLLVAGYVCREVVVGC